jgi:uncharacterized protein (DUF4415 family)
MRGRPRQGLGIKKHVSVRIDETLIEKILSDYGSIQKFLDELLEQYKEKKGGDNESV